MRSKWRNPNAMSKKIPRSNTPFSQDNLYDYKMCTVTIALLDPSSPYFLGKETQKIDHVWLSHEEMYTMSSEALVLHEFPTREKEKGLSTKTFQMYPRVWLDKPIILHVQNSIGF